VILYRVPTSGREGIGELIEKSELGEALIREENGAKRWIPKHWIIEEES
jgi:hypothetical protein